MKIQPGMAITCNGRLGTLGLLVKRKSDPNTAYLLSCYHVLDGGDGSSNVMLDGDTLIANYQRSDVTACEQLDAAIAPISANNHFELSNTVYSTDNIISKTRYAKKHLAMIKMGASTQITRCEVEKPLSQFGSLNFAVMLKQYPSAKATYCDAGDSGAVWKAIGTERGVVMHSQGGLPGNKAVGILLVKILAHFDLVVL